MPPSSARQKPRGLPALRNRPVAWVVSGCAVLVVALVLFLLLRDRSVVLAVPRAELPAYERLMAGLATGRNPPRVRVRAMVEPEESILARDRPGLAVVSLRPWVRKAIADGRLRPLPGAAFPSGAPPVARALLSAIGDREGTLARDGTLPALPLAYDPWMAVWHRDFIGGAHAAPPESWNDIATAGARWRKSGAVALALPGREPDALLSWLAALSTAPDPAVAAEAFDEFPRGGREIIGNALARLSALQRDGIVQDGSFTYPWADALNMVFRGRAAGTLLPISRIRGIDPVSGALLIVARLPELAGAAGFGLLADVRVLVMPARGARGRGVEQVIAFLARTGTQRSLADALRMVPARLDSPVRDGASFEAMAAARGASALLVPPVGALEPRDAAALAAAAETVLRSPSAVEDTVSALFKAP